MRAILCLIRTEMKKSLKITCWIVGVALVATIGTYFYRHLLRTDPLMSKNNKG